MNCFQQGYKDVHLFEQQNNEDGLYKNQIGAIGASLAHFSVRKEPALISMPTGTGKTAVMIMLSYLMKANKILVLTPSQLVREQIAGQFRDPALLISKGILPQQNPLLRVYEMTSIIEDRHTWEQILYDCDVVVGIPGTIDKISNLNENIGANIFDLVFVDEAHHSRAKSWSSVLNAFSSAKQIFLTATPFRRDKKEIKARLVYNYPLKQAYEDGLFSRIDYIPVNVDQLGNEDEKNIAIAQKAEEVFKARNYPEHKIIIRTDTKLAQIDFLKFIKRKLV